jgi:predicted nucleic acid-binding protein
VSYLLDANVLINWLTGRFGVATFMDELASGPEPLAVNAISVAELYSGIADADLAATQRVMSAFDYWPIDEPTARLAGSYRYRYARLGTSLSVTDVVMAAHAVRRDATLITSNLKDFPMPELNVMHLPLESR